MRSPFAIVSVLLFACDSPSSGGAVDGETHPDLSDGSDIGEVGDSDEGTPDVGDGFACGAGGLVCAPGSVCVGTGQGACMGPPPGADGQCEPNCEPYTCGGFEPVCLCAWFECDAPPDGCDSCTCLEGIQAYGSCLCEERDGELYLDCPGA